MPIPALVRRPRPVGIATVLATLLAAVLAACGEAPAMVTPPKLVSTSPAAGASGVSLDAQLALTFSKPMDPTSLAVVSEPPVDLGEASWSGPTVAVFTPPSGWPGGVTVTLTIAATDTDGEALAEGTSLTFSTALVVTDDVPPAKPTGVVATALDGGFRLDWELGAEDDLAGYQLQWGADPATPTGGVFVPLAGTAWTVTDLANGVKVYYRLQALDTSGNLSEAYAGDVTPMDMAPPTLASSTPADGATDLGAVSFVRLVFSEPMDAPTLTASYCEVESAAFAGACQGPVTPLAGAPTTSDAGAAVRWETPGAFQQGHAYRVTVGGADLAGNPVAAGTRVQFQLASEPDFEAPTFVRAAYDVDAVANRLTLTIEFSEAMDQEATRNAFGSSPGLACAWTWLTPTTMECRVGTGLQQYTTYQLAVATSAADLAGNALATPWTSEYVITNLHPRLVSVTPRSGAINVGYTTPIVFTFSEPMDPATLAYAVVRQTAGGDVAVPTTAAFEDDQRVLRLTPTSAYPGSATIRWTVTALAEAGGQFALAAPATGAFTTRLVVGP